MDQPQTSLLSRLKTLPKKQLVTIAVLVVILITLIAFTFLIIKKKQEQVTKAPEVTAVVSITKTGFVPATLSIKSGQTVKWTNDDDSPHRVASNPHPTHTGLPDFDSKNNLEKGASFTFTFKKPGSFGYHDHLNPQSFQGIISVQ